MPLGDIVFYIIWGAMICFFLIMLIMEPKVVLGFVGFLLVAFLVGWGLSSWLGWF